MIRGPGRAYGSRIQGLGPGVQIRVWGSDSF